MLVSFLSSLQAAWFATGFVPPEFCCCSRKVARYQFYKLILSLMQFPLVKCSISLLALAGGEGVTTVAIPQVSPD